MNTVKQFIQPVMTTLCTVLVACSSTSLEGGSFAKIKVIADPGVSVIGNGLNTGTNEFEQADVVITDIEFELAENCENENEDEGEINFEGPYVVDLLSEKSRPSLDEIELAKEKYCKFKFKLDKLDDDDLPSGVDNEMIDKSVLIKGVHDGDIPFVVPWMKTKNLNWNQKMLKGLS